MCNKSSCWTDSVIKYLYTHMHSNNKKLTVIAVCSFPSSLWVSSVLVCPFDVWLGGWKWAPQQSHACQSVLWEGTDCLTLYWRIKGCEPSATVAKVSFWPLCFPVYVTCLSRPDAVWALSSGLEGWIQLLRNVPDMLSLSVNHHPWVRIL